MRNGKVLLYNSLGRTVARNEHYDSYILYNYLNQTWTSQEVRESVLLPYISLLKVLKTFLHIKVPNYHPNHFQEMNAVYLAN